MAEGVDENRVVFSNEVKYFQDYSVLTLSRYADRQEVVVPVVCFLSIILCNTPRMSIMKFVQD